MNMNTTITYTEEEREQAAKALDEAIRRRAHRLREDNLSHEESIRQACGFAPRSATQLITSIRSMVDELEEIVLKGEIRR